MSKGAKKFCVICGDEFEGWGNNPWPIKNDGWCCDLCNLKKVIPARILAQKEAEKHGR